MRYAAYYVKEIPELKSDVFEWISNMCNYLQPAFFSCIKVNVNQSL